MVEVHKPVKSVYWVFKHLFNEYRQPKAVKLAKKASKDGNFPWILTEFGLEAAKLHGNTSIYLIEGKTQVLEEDFLDKHVHFPESLKYQDKKKEAAHVFSNSKLGSFKSYKDFGFLI